MNNQELENIIKYVETEVEYAKERYESNKQWVARDLRELATKLDEGKMYSTDAENVSNWMIRLDQKRIEYDEKRSKLEILKLAKEKMEE